MKNTNAKATKTFQNIEKDLYQRCLISIWSESSKLHLLIKVLHVFDQGFLFIWSKCSMCLLQTYLERLFSSFFVPCSERLLDLAMQLYHVRHEIFQHYQNVSTLHKSNSFCLILKVSLKGISKTKLAAFAEAS